MTHLSQQCSRNFVAILHDIMSSQGFCNNGNWTKGTLFSGYKIFQKIETMGKTNITRKGRDHSKSTPPLPGLAVRSRLQAAMLCAAEENELMVIIRNMSDTLHKILTAKSHLLPEQMGLIRWEQTHLHEKIHRNNTCYSAFNIFTLAAYMIILSLC